MLPLRDDVPSSTTPFVNYALIAANIVAFFFELSFGDNLDRLFELFAVIPGYYYNGEQSFLLSMTHWTMTDQIVPIFTSMFLHGGWVHLFGNMLFLWIFGDNVEDALGHGRYVIFYLLCGVIGALAHIYMSPGSPVPTIGASGAIAGVLGAYLLLFPRARVAVLVPIFIFIEVIWLPAFIVLGGWFLLQLLNGSMAVGPHAMAGGGTAYWAHIGGFLAGMVFVWGFRTRRSPRLA